ncbi:MAG: YrdB family protein [Devosia sp.]|nr:YrdB family protein [Devosia sp.]
MAHSRPRSRYEMANLALAFLLELVALAGFALLATLLPDSWLRLVGGAVAVAAFVGLWAVFAAPRSKRRLKMPMLMWFKIGMFAVATVGLVASGLWFWAGVFAVLVAVNLMLMGYFRHW